MKLVAFIIFYLLSLSTAAQNWEVSYEQALSRAAQENKPIVLVFAGSDWCAPCIKLDREIWTSEIFKAHALKNYVLYRADFPRKKKNQLSKTQIVANKKLADSFNPEGYFPLVVLVDSQEKVLGTTSYKKVPPQEYINHLNSFLK